ncbi:MAG: efflux RND transporter periplasmic adaptor subunit [Acidobacteria bacterium]|nr:efflux RND transporter periplasmic adaptor subunit [Acidobacteriota bacterium]
MKNKIFLKPRRLRYLGIFLLLLLAAGVGFYIWGPHEKSMAATIPNAEVKLGEFIDYVELRGEIAVRSSKVITAPYNAGDLQILKLVQNGASVKKRDVVAEFDPTTVKRNADQYRAALNQVEAEIERTKAQRQLLDEQNKTEMMSAQFGLERAQLDAGTRDVVPAIEHEKNVLALAKAEQKLRELDTRLESSQVGAEADLAGALRKRKKAKEDLEQAERNLDELVLRSPGDGIITLLPNSRARISVISGSTPAFKEGDRAWAGAAIAALPDMSTIHATAPVYEADRGRIELGQRVTLNIEAVPDKVHEGSVSEISPLAKIDYTTYPYRKSFAMRVQLNQPDSRLRAGMTAALRVEVERMPNSIVIPAEAVFDKLGRMVAYVLTNGGYQERKLDIERRSGGKVLVASGLKQGERVALKDPTLPENREKL